MSRRRSPSRKWRSPKEVLYIREDKESKRHHDLSKPVMSAFDTLTQENIELKALVEILKAKNKADSSKHLDIGIKCQEQEVQIEENYRLISRLQKDLHNANSDVINDSVNECLELRHLLEASHIETASLDKSTKKEIAHLQDRLALLQSQTSVAEKKSSQAEAALKEARIDFRLRVTRSAVGAVYSSCAGVYKRILGRSLHQWRASTAAAVALDSQLKLDVRHREQLREKHSVALSSLSTKHETSRLELLGRLQTMTESRDGLRDRFLRVKARKIWGNDEALQVSAFGGWRGAHLRSVTEERNRLGEAVVTLQEQLKTMKLELQGRSSQLDGLNFSIEQMRIDYRRRTALEAVLRVAAQCRGRREQLKRAYGYWQNICLLQRRTALARKEVKRITSNNGQREKNFQLTVQKYKQCHHHNKKLNKKVEAYREITSSIATVMRYHSIIYRCFSSWKQYSFETKIKRVGTWPELWRLSKLTPDSNKQFGDIMHESSDLQLVGEERRHRHQYPSNHHHQSSDSFMHPDSDKSVLSSSSLSSVSSPQMLLHQYSKGSLPSLEAGHGAGAGMRTKSDTGKTSHLMHDRGSRGHGDSEDDPARQLQRQHRADHLQVQRQKKTGQPNQRHEANSSPSNRRKNDGGGRDGRSPHDGALQDLFLSQGSQEKNPPPPPGGNIFFLDGAIEEEIDFDDYYDAQEKEQRDDDEYSDDYHEGAESAVDPSCEEDGDRLSEAHDLDLESSFSTNRSQLSGGGSYSGGSLAFSGTLGSYKLGHSGGFSATGDFSHAVALNPTPSMEYLHLLSPGKEGATEGGIEHETRANTRKNKLRPSKQEGLAEGDEEEECGLGERGQVRSSLTFDRETMELKLEEGVSGESNRGGSREGNDDSLGLYELDSDCQSPSHGSGDVLSANSRTGEYSNALSMFSPSKGKYS